MESNINLHLHAHMKTCILEYGPVYSFWLFAFERLNGILEAYKTNSHDITVQLMRRFLSSRDCSVQFWPEEFKRDFSSMLENCSYSKGSLSHESLPILLSLGDNEIIEPTFKR